jgi:hypothetical protein
VERRYGSFVLSGDETALRLRYDEAEMMVQEQSLVPADLRDMPSRRDVPSRPATVLGTRQGATEQHQQQQARCQGVGAAYELDLFRSCSDVEAAAVDPRGGHPAGAGRRCCGVVAQGAAVAQLLMWWRKKARRSLSALVVVGS